MTEFIVRYERTTEEEDEVTSQGLQEAVDASNFNRNLCHDLVVENCDTGQSYSWDYDNGWKPVEAAPAKTVEQIANEQDYLLSKAGIEAGTKEAEEFLSKV